MTKFDKSLILVFILLSVDKINTQNSSSSESQALVTSSATVASINVTLDAVNTTTTPTTATTITTTTTKKDECSINSTYCNNNGNCSYDTNNNKICKCNQNYSGNECESRLCEKDDSGYDQCSPNGKCFFNIKTKQAYCLCSPEYIGALCEKSICDVYCYNNGVCDFKINETTSCKCLDRFFGPFCQFDYCKSDVEKCDKKCYLYKNGTDNCSCACEEDCKIKFCNGKGVCKGESPNLTCNCETGWSGPQCKVEKCNGYCFNNGTCSVNQSDVFCKCTENFAGPRCQDPFVPAKKSSSGRAFITILILTLCIAIIALVFFTYKRGGFDYIREKFENLSYRLRSSYETNGTRSNIPYVQTHNKPEDSYTDPFS